MRPKRPKVPTVMTAAPTEPAPPSEVDVAQAAVDAEKKSIKKKRSGTSVANTVFGQYGKLG